MQVLEDRAQDEIFEHEGTLRMGPSQINTLSKRNGVGMYRLRVPPPDPGHDLGALFGGEDVRH
jgi:hypothetical protein